MGFNKKLVAKVEVVLAQVGGAIDTTNPNPESLIVDAPAKKVWRANENHSLTAQTMDGPQAWYVEAVDTLLEDLSMGVDDCTDPDCDFCHHSEDA